MGELARFLAILTVAAATPAMAQDDPMDHPLSVWTKPAADGSVEHLQSGLKCPQAIGTFARVSYKNLNPFGLDVLCGWNGQKTAVTAYMTRGPSLQAMFDAAKAAVEKNDAFEGVRKTADGPVEAWGIQWLRATYVTVIGARTEVWVADFAGWTLKYRVTYRDEENEALTANLGALSQVALVSAGPRAAVCGKSVAPERKGKLQRGAGKDSGAMGLASILGIAAATSATLEGDGEEAKPPIYCVEQRVTTQKAPMLLWRGVSADGEDALVDRVSIMTLGAPITLDLSLDMLGSMIGAELDKRGGGAALDGSDQ